MDANGCCIWFTGLPAAGKTTLATLLTAELTKAGISADRLDGDVVRKSFCADLGFSKEDRDENIKRNSYVAAHLSHTGRVAVCAFVSPYQEARDKVRKLTKHFVEVFVSCPLEECERRDAADPNRFGLYAKARVGEIKNCTGIDDPYEEPPNPEIVIDTLTTTPEEGVALIVQYLRKVGLI